MVVPPLKIATYIRAVGVCKRLSFLFVFYDGLPNGILIGQTLEIIYWLIIAILIPCI